MLVDEVDKIYFRFLINLSVSGESSASVYMYLQVQMAACGSPSVADITDDLPGLHLLVGGDTNAGAVCI